ITANKSPRGLKPVGEWNRGRLVVTPDNQVTHYLNGFKVLSYTRGSDEYHNLVERSKYKGWENFGLAEKGHILLQDHGDRVSVRNIKLKTFDSVVSTMLNHNFSRRSFIKKSTLAGG